MATEPVNDLPQPAEKVAEAETRTEQDILKDEIRRFAQNVFDSKLKTHEICYTAITKSISRSESVPEPFVKALINLSVTAAVKRYVHKQSFQLVTTLLDALAKQDCLVCIKTLAQVVNSLFPILPNISETVSRTAYYPTIWITKLLGQFQATESDLVLIMSALSSLSYYCSISVKKRSFFDQKLSLSPCSNEALEKGLKDLSKDPSIPAEKTLCLLVAVIELRKLPLYSEFCDLYTKVCLLSKVRPQNLVLSRCRSVIGLVPTKEFSDVLLPNLKKALLRSPEISIYGVLDVLSIRSNLESSADELIKAISGSISSANDELREKAIHSISAIAKRAGDVSTVKKAVLKLFENLSGAKSAEQRIALYQGIESCSRVPNSVKGSEFDKLANDIVSRTAKAEKDTHEETVAAQWSAAAAWACALSQPSSELTNMFKESTKLPSSVKSAGYRALARVMRERKMNDLPDGSSDLLWNNLDAAQKEALDAIGLTLILLMTSGNNAALEKQKTAWEKMSTNEIVFKDKSLSSIKYYDALLWVDLAALLIASRPANFAYPPVVVKSLALLLFWPHSDVRREALNVLVKILKKEKAPFAELMADTIYSETVNGQLEQLLRKVPQSHDCTEWSISGEQFVAVLQKLLITDSDDLDNLAIHTLLLGSMPRLVEVDGSVWLRWMHGVEKDFIEGEKFREAVIDKVLLCSQRDVRDNALITLVVLNVTSLKADLWQHVETRIKDFDVKECIRISERDVSIYKCPDGQLYNMDALDFDEGEQAANMKRENKAYSYKEQLQESQLRRELAEKKRKEGKLTPKQKQVMEKELAAEKIIREQVKEVYDIAEGRLDETRAMVAADPHGALLRSYILYDQCLPLTKSALVSQEAYKLFLAYRDAAFPHSEDYLDELIASCFLRAIGSRTHSPNWAQEPINAALSRAFSLLNERAFVVETGDDDAQDDAFLFDEIVGAPQLTFIYPLVKTILGGSYPDKLKADVLNLLQNSIHKRFLKDNTVLHLPMLEFADLLLGYYSNNLDNSCLNALVQLMRLVNETEDAGDRVVSMVRGALNYLTCERPEVRESVIKILSAPQLLTRLVLESSSQTFPTECLVRLFVARHDPIESVADAATELWLASLLHLRPVMSSALVDECVSEVPFIRESAARALSTFAEESSMEMTNILVKVDEVYRDLSEIRGAIFDEVGRMQRDAVDEWQRRSGIGLALGYLAKLVGSSEAEQLIRIVVPLGLNDRQAICRNSMCSAAVEAINHHGREIMGSLLPYLEKLSDTTPEGAQHDNQRQGLVVLLGTLAQYLEPSSEKVKAIVLRLIEILNTPSQTVQESVSQCLPPLVPAVREDCKAIIGRLQILLFNAESYGERRGAAYGIAGFVKGMGLFSLKDLELLPTIEKALTDKKNWKYREGGLMALEILCSSIGKLFEPYIIKVLPSLLVLFGDNDENVRKAAEDTARAMMASMSVYGTKLVLPLLLRGLDDDSWRTKCAATELLGSMAFCAPKQLSSCLPSIVPKLIEVLADSSSKVQRSGEKALRQIARVVRNPEILGVTNQIMIGLLDPANKTSFALQAVLNTKFIHYIDAPSLALLMPIVRRAFEDRNSETRRVAAQIIANIYNLTEHKDMEPYLSDLVPGLQKSLLDPVPEIRTVAARALGAIVSKSSGATSERLRDAVIPWLKEKLISPQSTVDRSGAAQGLCEVLAGSGTEQLDYVMPEIISVTESTEVSAETRDGYILMYIYLPLVFGEKFVAYLPKVVPPILKALADENEYVRASALKAGQRLIQQYCSHARKLLLPQLQNALMDDNWRIRYAAVQLIGDFLFNISGVSGKSTSDTANEDDTMGMEQAGKTIVRALGQQCRDRVLAGLYLARSDVALVVRQAAGHVWKIVVSNTPRTLKEIMKILFEMVVDSLASTCEERQQCGARCLGELVRKMGEKIINEILPILEQNQNSDNVEKRVGVAVALHEIIDNMSKDVLSHYLPNIVGPLKGAVCDNESSVRAAAADAFSVLYRSVGHEALDEIVTPLLEKLTPEQDHILEGLCEVMKQNSKQMLPYLLPKLTKPPVNVHALCSLASVAGDSLSRQLPRVLDALLQACVNNDQYDPMIDSCEKVVIAVGDEDGVPVLTDYLLQRAAKGNVPAAVLLHTFVEKTEVPLNDLVDVLLSGLLNLYSSPNAQIVDHTVCAAISVAQHLDPREMHDVLPSIKKTLNILVSQAKGAPIPGFGHPKGLNPFAPMLKEAILQGGVELKALAGETLGMIISVSQESALKTHVINVTGPLIRVLGDRYPPNVKLAILDTLSRLLDKVASLLRPFLPQLQSTFLKALQDPASRAVRMAAAGALSRLMKIHPKPEPVILELFKFLAGAQDEALLETSFIAARAVLKENNCATKLASTTVDEGFRVCGLIFNNPVESPSEMDNSLTQVSGLLFGELAVRTNRLDEGNIYADVESSSEIRVRQAKAYALLQMCQADAATVWSEKYSEIKSAFNAAFLADPGTASVAARAAALIVISGIESPDRDLLAALLRAVNHQSVDVRRTAAVCFGHIFKAASNPLPNDLLKIMIPQLVNGCKESNSAARSAAELALVYAFHIVESDDVFNGYRSCVEGAAKSVLDEIHVALRRVVKHGDIALEPLYNCPMV